VIELITLRFIPNSFSLPGCFYVWKTLKNLNHQNVGDVVMIIFCSRLVILIVAILHAMKTKY